MRGSLMLYVAIAMLVGCASIDHTTKAQQRLNRVLIAGPGDTVIRIDRERNLENAFGKADIFGRKTKEGFTELRFAGVEPDGGVVLYRMDTDIVSNETTMSRTPATITSATATSSVSGVAKTARDSTRFQGAGTTNYTSTTLSPISDFHVVVPLGSVPIRLAADERRIPVAGFILEIISVSKNSLEYRVSKQGR